MSLLTQIARVVTAFHYFTSLYPSKYINCSVPKFASITVLLILLAPLLTIQGCRKKIEHVYLPTDFNDVVLFDTGSYWVYGLKGAGEEDSIVVVEINSYEIDMFPESKRSTQIRHEYTYQLNGYNTKYSARTSVYTTNILSTTLQGNRTNPSVIVTEGGSGYLTSMLIYPFNQGVERRIVAFDDYERIDTILPTLIVNNVEYQNVIKFYSPYSEFFLNQATHKYFVHGIGLVRIDYVKSGEIWELKRHKVKLIK